MVSRVRETWSRVPASVRPVLAAVLTGAVAAGGLLVGLGTLVNGIEPPDLEVPTSPMVLDREGRLLRPFTVADGRWRMPLALADLDPKLIDMLLAFEDRRFREHEGVDPRALVRAAVQMVMNGRVVSGGGSVGKQHAKAQCTKQNSSFHIASSSIQSVRAHRFLLPLLRDCFRSPRMLSPHLLSRP